MFTKEQRYGCGHEFDCLVCGMPIVEQYFPNDCICCDCIDRGYDHTFENGKPVVIVPKDHSLVAEQPVQKDGQALVDFVYAVETVGYCEHCGVVAIVLDDKYCIACCREVRDSLAERYMEYPVRYLDCMLRIAMSYQVYTACSDYEAFLYYDAIAGIDEDVVEFSEQIAVDGGLY